MDVKEVENVEDYLGIEIEYDKQAQTIKLSQKKYLQRVLKRFGMENCNSKRQPIAKDHKIQNDNLQPLDEAEKLRYLAIVGSLTYAIQGTRPDLAFSVSYCSRFLAQPAKQHMEILKSVLRYVKGTLDYGITYKVTATKGLTVYTDSSFNSSIEGRDSKATSGWVAFLAGGPIAWSSKRQSCVTTSTTEAEYVAQCNAVKFIAYMAQFLHELRLPVYSLPITLYGDSHGAAALALNPTTRGRSGHIDIALHYQREKVEDGLVRMESVASTENAADGFTKPLSGESFARFTQMLRIQPEEDSTP
jgi:hypothetical protein